MSEVSRRAVVAAGVAGAGLITALAVQAPAAVAGTRTGSSRPVSSIPGPHAVPGRAVFRAAVGQTFSAVGAATALSLRLDSVDDLAAEAEPGTDARFGLHFASFGFTAPEGIYSLSTDGVPATSLFLSPVGPHGAVRTMQAVVVRSA